MVAIGSRLILILCVGFMWSSMARGQHIDVLLDDDFSETTGLNENQVRGQLDTAIQQDLNLEGQADYLARMARASAIANRGMGVDYFVMPNRIVVGGSLGSGANGGGLRSSDDSLMPQGGFAWQASGMVGLNLGALSTRDGFARRFVVFANAMTLNRNRDPFTANSSNWGGHLQIRLIKPKNLITAEWGGLALTGGYEWAQYEMSLSETMSIDEGDIVWEPVGSYTIRSISQAIPIELSTSIRVLFFGVYGGIGVDIPAATRAEAEVGLDGDIFARVQGNRINVGHAEVSLETSNDVDQLVTRFFTGVQFKLAVAHAYGHLNVGTDQSIGLHMGLRVGL